MFNGSQRRDAGGCHSSHSWSHSFSPGPHHQYGRTDIWCNLWTAQTEIEVAAYPNSFIVSTLSFGLQIWQTANIFSKYLEINARALRDANSHGLWSTQSADGDLVIIPNTTWHFSAHLKPLPYKCCHTVLCAVRTVKHLVYHIKIKKKCHQEKTDCSEGETSFEVLR